MVTFIMLSYDVNAIDNGIDAVLDRYGKGLVKPNPQYPVMSVEAPLSDSQDVIRDITAIFQNKQVHVVVCDEEGNLTNSTL